MELAYRVLDISELDHVVALEQKLLAGLQIPEHDAMVMAWHAPWRRESLEHYLPKGWCFGAWRKTSGSEELAGYFLAQPLIFFRGYTQTLWVEHLAAADENVKLELIELARRYGRDKHLQSVLFADNQDLRAALTQSGGQKIGDSIIEFRTTKVRT
ncbi:MAG TPA: hypothetical protein VFV50_01090 [Bdellovibrionales bacterium]|nr:hypothetical protein [Bdellovibrionales bacterium]